MHSGPQGKSELGVQRASLSLSLSSCGTTPKNCGQTHSLPAAHEVHGTSRRVREVLWTIFQATRHPALLSSGIVIQRSGSKAWSPSYEHEMKGFWRRTVRSVDSVWVEDVADHSRRVQITSSHYMHVVGCLSDFASSVARGGAQDSKTKNMLSRFAPPTQDPRQIALKNSQVLRPCISEVNSFNNTNISSRVSFGSLHTLHIFARSVRVKSMKGTQQSC